MPWAKDILLVTMAVMTLSSSLRADPEAFPKVGAAYGAASENPVRFGKLLIGGQSMVSYKDAKTSVSESDGYRSNKEAWLLPAKAKLQRLGSSVQCSNDSMTLRIPGPRMPHFLVDRGEESPVPLSEMPASCGFSLKRVRRDVSLVAPYQGCHVKQQDGSYILPLIIMGAPVRLSCPVSPRLPTVSCLSTGMIATLGIRADDVKVLVDGSWQPLLLIYTQCSFTLKTTDGSLVVTAPFTGSCWLMTDTEMQLPLMYGDREVTLSCPLTQPTIAPTTPADPDMFDPFPFGRPWWYPPYYPRVPATLPPTVPTTTPTPFQYPFPQHMFPPMYPRPVFDPYFYSRGDPAAAPAQQPQRPWYPNFPPYMYGFQSPVKVTTPDTTTATPAPYQLEQYPMFPLPFVPPAVKYPFMPKYPKDPVFSPRSPKSVPSRLSSVYRP